MAIGNFLKNYGKAKSEQISDGIVNLAASLDAAGVSEAAIKQKQDEHNELVRQLVVAQTEFKNEKKEFEDIEALYSKRLAGAEKALAAGDEKSATTLFESVEKIAPKLAKEKADFERAEKWMLELQQASDDVAKELLTLREKINEVNQAKADAELQADKNRKLKEQAEKLAGLRNATNKFDIALTALQKQADTAQQEADALRITAEQLTIKPTQLDDVASKYLEEDEPTSTETLAERLARLKTAVK